MKKYGEEFCQKEQLRYDKATGIYSGQRQGYSFMVIPNDKGNLLTIAVSLSSAIEVDKAQIKSTLKETKVLIFGGIQGRRLNFTVKAGMTMKKTMENLSSALGLLPDILHRLGYSNACSNCGKIGETAAYIVNADEKLLCEDCFHEQSQAVSSSVSQKNASRESVIGGIVGAFLGSLLGVAVMVILGQLGYVAVVSGIVMGVCTTKGYELLGRKLSKKGIFISVVVMIAMTVVAHRLDWAISIAREFSGSVIDAFIAVPYVVADMALETNYYGNLALLAVFTLLGGLSIILSANKRRKLIGSSYKI